MSKSNTVNTRPLLTPEDRQVLRFALAAVKDDRIKGGPSGNPSYWEERYDQAEKLLARLAGM